MKLAVFDNHPPVWAGTIVPFLDLLGYSRYWATEQHSPHQSGSPIIMAAAAGGRSKRMRIGTAGVMLRINSPHRVLTDFKALQFLYPGRVDMGFVSSAPKDPLGSKLCNQPSSATPSEFSARVREIVALARGENSEGKDHVRSTHLSDAEIWLCGSSLASARLAAELGICYAYHDSRHVSGPATGPTASTMPFLEAPTTTPTRTYLDEFRPHASLPSPRLSLACYGICAETTAEAQLLWERDAGCDRDKRRWSAGFCGRPEECREQLQAMQEKYGAHEIAIQTMNRDLSSCLTSYSLLADACLAM